MIDEAQDLSLVQMKAMMNVYTKDMSIAMDANNGYMEENGHPKNLGLKRLRNG